ncbi:PAS domain S-box-containing protein [Pseudoduganella lurida]|uniref:histidine kinase n=1 Tax=Pseudoduganella lurida TaxID=1036180 RepID=A0A562R8V3_9BURK|nr:ATP-binding protein [Pseudoduganella lurida]TWI65472.1 PAS domain S-box-containing protein [Pseudoduganella lurida]
MSSAIFRALPAPCVLLSPALEILEASDAFLRATGSTRARVVGRSVFDAFPDNPADPGADGVANLRASLERVLASKAPDTMPLQRYDVPNAGIFEEKYWRPVNTPVLDDAGAVSCIIHQVDDVTYALRTQQLRMRGQARPRQAPTFMAVLAGPQHRVELMDEGFLRLTGHRDLVGHPVTEGFDGSADGNFALMLDEVYRSGVALTANSTLYPVQAVPGGPVAGRYIDFAFKPVRGESGGVEGVFIEGVDVTDRVLNDTRRDALVRLTDALRDLRSPADIAYTAAAILGETLGASRVGYGRYNPATDTLYVGRDWCAPGMPSLEGTVQLREFGGFVDDMRRGQDVVIADVDQDPRTASFTGRFRAYRTQAFVNISVIEQGQLKSVLVVNDTVPRQWAVEDVALMKEFAERTRTASERARTMEALVASEGKFRTITNAMPQMVWSTQPDGFHDYYNAQWYEYTGMEPGTTDGAGWNAMFHPDDREPAWQAWRHSLATGEVYEIQYRLRHRSGEYRWTLGRALPIRNAAGDIVRWMGTCTDIHSQKLAEDELRDAAARKDEFLAMLAHELRNPLAPISTAAQLLKAGRADERTRQAASDIIVRQVKHMAHLVDDLLDVSRVTRGLVQLDMAELDLKGVVSSAIEQALPLIEARHHRLDLRRSTAAAPVRGDRTRLVQVIANVLNNAAKYTSPGGRIALELAVADGQARITVRDNGNGIAPALLPHIFDLFIQGERNPDRAQGGLGLGLTLVKSITALHGGSVTVDSEGPGTGSTFTICLPLSLAAGAAVPATQGPDAPPPARRALRLMVVDDNVDAAHLLAALLRAEGHEVVTADDAESALRHPQLGTRDAFILDIGLPGMDGYELARRLRAAPDTASSRLIALTGYGQPNDVEASHDAGFDHHFVKPADPGKLMAALVA